jgi:hypothetical protein
MCADNLYPVHTGMLYDRHMCKDISDESLYILCTYELYTMYILSTYLQTTAHAGFRGARRDEDIQAGGPVSTQPHVTDDAEGDDNPCTEDEEFFQEGPKFQRWMRRNRKYLHHRNYSYTDMHWNTGFCSYSVHTLYILEHFCSYIVHTLYKQEHFC